MRHRLSQLGSSLQIWQIDALGALIVGIAATAWYFGGLQPLSQARAARQSMEAELTSQRDQERKNLEILAKNDKSLAKIQDDIAKSDIKLLSPDRVNQRVADLTALATGSGLRVDEIKPSSPAAQPRFTMVPIRISGMGGYRAVSAFLQELRQQFRDTGVTGFELKTLEKDDASDLKFVFELVWYAAPTAQAIKN